MAPRNTTLITVIPSVPSEFHRHNSGQPALLERPPLTVVTVVRNKAHAPPCPAGVTARIMYWYEVHVILSTT